MDDQVYNDDISDRCFVRLASSNNDSLHSFSTKWAPISSNDSYGFSDREIKLSHQNHVDIVLDDENAQSNIVDHQNNIILEKKNVQSNIVKVKNPVAKRRKGHPRGAQCILSSIEVN
ncbi:hypothetical protein F8M41_025552 [Gigaspora margarita]|uniref:Uncharacterized protein n=1 Tax=Gigaspora margarita TaxID=4874 RepID=A0A8H3XJ49_GIGMA|nr:hypothetical protein F8M41_025552 [Gigaspora margarita]